MRHTESTMTVYSFCRRSVFILDTEEEEFVYQHATVKMSNKGEFLSVILVKSVLCFRKTPHKLLYISLASGPG